VTNGVHLLPDLGFDFQLFFNFHFRYLLLLIIFIKAIVSMSSSKDSDQSSHGVMEFPVVVFVPCSRPSGLAATNEECDPYIYPAILQAVEDVNTNESVLWDGLPEELRVRLQISTLISTVSQSVIIFIFLNWHGYIKRISACNINLLSLSGRA